MNKKAIIKTAALDAGLSYKNEQKAVEAFLCAVSDILKSEKEVVLPDFGKFSVQEFAERNVRHPRTGEVITIPATKRVRFKPLDKFGCTRQFASKLALPSLARIFGNITHYRRKYGV